jgi:class 3 adenylate cyclase
MDDEPIKLRTWLCSVVFIDVVGYSIRPVEVQMTWKGRFNRYVADAIEDLAESDRVILDTGDGAAICFLGDPEAAMFATLRLLDSLARLEPKEVDPMRVRIGINLGSIKLVKDINGRLNAVGDGINVAQRVMSFAGQNEILVSRSFYEVVSCLSDSYNRLFHYNGVRKDKHVREHTVYDLRPPGAPAPAAVDRPAAPEPEPAAPATGGRVDPAAVTRIEAALAAVLGPIAKRVVKQHAARAASAGELCQSLAELIPGKDDQELFLRQFAAAPAPSIPAPPATVAAAPSPANAPTGAAEHQPAAWEPATLERARAALAVYVGPMARVMVTRAAAKARTLKQLYDLLTNDIPSEPDRAAFRKAIAATRGA